MSQTIWKHLAPVLAMVGADLRHTIGTIATVPTKTIVNEYAVACLRLPMTYRRHTAAFAKAARVIHWQSNSRPPNSQPSISIMEDFNFRKTDWTIHFIKR